MSRIKSCKFCDRKELKNQGTILIKKRNYTDSKWLELYLQDDNTLTIYITDKESWDPECKMEFKITNCPRCGRDLTKGGDKVEGRYRSVDEKFKGR